MSIIKSLQKQLRFFLANERGVVAIIFGLAAIPVIGLTGASLDYSRASNVQSQLQGALDASVLSAAHERDMTDSEVETFMRSQIEAHMGGALGAGSLTLDITRGGEDDLLVAAATMQIDTTILGIMGINHITVGVDSSVSVEFRTLEVALVLDNTGSMSASGRIGSLRDAAQDFVEVVTEDGQSDNVLISLVPYTAQVNIGNSASMEQFLDTQGLSQHHAEMIEGAVIARDDSRSCRNAVASIDHNATGPEMDFAEADLASQNFADEAPRNFVPGFARLSFLDAYGDALRELVGINTAHASTVQPYDYVIDGCFIYNPDQISHWQLYEQLDDVEWKGCVEARPEPFDVTDAAPDSNNADTLWVPGFWIDDTGSSWYASNNWLSDRENDLPGSDYDFEDDGDVYSVYKYSSSAGHDVDEVPNSTLGPAQNCGDPILPLTDDFSLLEDRIDDMTYWYSGGTVTAQGVAWGWRTLSPAAPFTEGAPYDEVTKVMVVMTDGRNELVSASDSAIGSHYSAYGQLAGGRFPSQSISAAREYIDGRTLDACFNAKAAGIIIYTVTFGLDSDSQAMWDTCATEASMAYHVDTSSELVGAFNEIADSVGELRLTR